MKKKIIICVVLLIVVIVGAIVLIGNTGSDNERGKEMDDFNKPVNEYTWEEFNDLSKNQQMEFQKNFDNDADFEEWMNDAQGNGEDEIPWENGGKQPKNYTWEEFNDLSKNQQMEFQYSFKNIDEFDKWLQKAQKEAGIE